MSTRAPPMRPRRAARAAARARGCGSARPAASTRPRLRPCDLRGVSDACDGSCGVSTARPSAISWTNLEEEAGAAARRGRARPRRWFRRPDRAAANREHRARVELLDDAHDRDAGLAVAGDDGPVHRRRTAPARQERAVHVDHAEAAGCCSSASGRSLPVRRHDAEVGRQTRRSARRKPSSCKPLRLQHRDAVRRARAPSLAVGAR